jgi:hypothetical protein
MPQLLQGLRLNLTHPLTGDAHDLANLFEGELSAGAVRAHPSMRGRQSSLRIVTSKLR